MMLILLSPAKKLLDISKPCGTELSMPLFLDKTHILAQLMQTKSVDEVAQLMHLSKDLAELNYHRYQTFQLDDKPSSRVYPALFLFQGDVYQGLDAKNWDQKTLHYAQDHLRILSGLYGLLNPLDGIQPYRLEMGTRLENPSGNSLYDFWKHEITNALNQQLAAHKTPVLINLASLEYVKAVDEKRLDYPIITINFYEKKNDCLKMIGIHAKKARGAMARFLIQNQFEQLSCLKEFNDLGYQFHPFTSSERHFDFVRAS